VACSNNIIQDMEENTNIGLYNYESAIGIVLIMLIFELLLAF
jgi:hypothetical protein